jgi:hypothetical protein
MERVPHSSTFSLFRSAHLYYVMQSEVQRVGSLLLHLIKAKESPNSVALVLAFPRKAMI